MNTEELVLIVTIVCLIFGIVVNYNQGATFGTNLIIIGLVGITVRSYMMNSSPF